MKNFGLILRISLVLFWAFTRAHGATFSVQMLNFRFNPVTLNIKQGDTVTWVASTAGHDTVSNDGLWSSAILNQGQQFSHTFNDVGSFGYICQPHVSFGMTGTINVTAGENTPPTVAITSPSNGATFQTTDSITVTANAADSGGITKVEFFSDGNLIGTVSGTPYTITIQPPLAPGTHSLTAKATDNLGASTTSAAVSITVNESQNPPPTVAITSPGNGATFQTTDSVTVTANATDNGSIAKVEFFSDGNSIGTVTGTPYTITVSPPLTPGTHSLTAKATDNLGASTTSAPVSINVNQPQQNTPPTVAITAPSNGATFNVGDNIAISATASDNGRVTGVEFFADGNSLGRITTPPYTVSTTTLPAGNHVLTAVAKDNFDASTTSDPVNIVVQSSTQNQLPTIALSMDPPVLVIAVGSNVTLKAAASDPDGTVTQVEFFNGTTSLNVDNSNPFEFSLSNLTAGTYNLTAVATDNSNGKTTSSALQLRVVAQPSLGITRDNDGTKLTVSGTTGIAHVVQATGDFGNWSEIGTVTPADGSATFTDSANESRRFYRVVVQ